MRFSLSRHILRLVLALLLFGSATTAFASVEFIGSSSIADATESLTVTKPAGVEQDHLMLVHVAFRGPSSLSLTPPSGWTLLAPRVSTAEDDLNHVVSYRFATSSAEESYTWQIGAAHHFAVSIAAYANVDRDDPINDTDFTTGNQTNPVAPSIIVTNPSAMLVGLWARIHQGPLYEPTSMSMRASSTAGSGNNGIHSLLADEPLYGTGETGDRTAVAGAGGSRPFIGRLIALNGALGSEPVQLQFDQQPTDAGMGSIISPSVTVRIEDADGLLVSDGTAEITLAISDNPASGVLSGTTTVNAVDGVATFDTISIDQPGTGYSLIATSSGLADENSTLFNITAAGAVFNAFEVETPEGQVGGVIRTKIAGVPFALDIVAIDGDGNVDEKYNNTVIVELLDATDNSGVMDDGNCRDSWTVISSAEFDGIEGGGSFSDWQKKGRGRIDSIEVNEAWPIVRVRIRRDKGQQETGCSTDAFAIRPDAFTNVLVTDADWGSAGGVRDLYNNAAAGGVVHKAGAPFSIAASAVDASGVNIMGYTGSPDVVVNCTLPGSGNCVDGVVDPGDWDEIDGDLLTEEAVYSEAGVFSMTLEDRDFAAVDNGDGSTEAERYIRSASREIGRFVPDRFMLSVDTEPMFLTFNDAACLGRAFTYLGQPFGFAIEPVARVEAVNVAGAVTRNYSHELWRLTGADVDQSYDAITNPIGQTLNTGGISQPVVLADDDGTGTVTSDPGDLLAFDRDAVPFTDDPPEPFTADMTLTVDLTDGSESGEFGNGVIATAAPLIFDDGGNGSTVFDAGNEFRYGRLRVVNAIGPENRELGVPVRAETWREIAPGSGVFGWMTEADDSCSGVVDADFALDDPTFTTVAGFTGLDAGLGALTLYESNNPGTVDVTAELENALIPWLRFDWNGDGAESDPVGRASFGFHESNPRRVYQREQF